MIFIETTTFDPLSVAGVWVCMGDVWRVKGVGVCVCVGLPLENSTALTYFVSTCGQFYKFSSKIKRKKTIQLLEIQMCTSKQMLAAAFEA